MRDRGMNEGEASKPHDETSGGQPRGAEGKRRHVQSRRYQEYLQQQGQTVPHKQKKCLHPSCQRVFSSAPGLRYHMMRVHTSTALKFSCSRCQKDFKSHNGLKYHQQRTKCQEMESAPRQKISLPVLSIPSLHSESRDVWGHTEQPVVSPSPVRGATPYAAESRHRKMEARRKSMKSSPPLVLPSHTRQAPSAAESERLLEFAEFATGPQSPLWCSAPADWDKINFPRRVGESGGQSLTDPMSDPPLRGLGDTTDISTRGIQRVLSHSLSQVTSTIVTAMAATSPHGTEQDASGLTGESSPPEQYSSAVVALSNMAKLKKQESRQQQPATQTKQKVKRPMNAFIRWSKTKRQEYLSKYPNTNNREISVMLSSEWREMDKGQKQRLVEEAKVQADLQRQQHPDCWKRKK